MHTVEEVLRLIEQEVRGHPDIRQVPIAQADGRILAQPVLMDCDSPPFERALLDGFAVRSADATPGAHLHIIGRQDAGSTLFQGAVASGQCLAINTGAVFPAGADALLMVEHTSPIPPSPSQPQLVQVNHAVVPGYGIQRRGADARQGQEILTAGTCLGPAQLAAAVTAGAADLSVRSRITVALLTTGDELVGPGAPLAPGQIRNSNHPMLAALLNQALGANAELLDLGTAGDHEADLRARLERGLDTAALTLVTGGMSMGTKDLVPPILKQLGVQFHVEKVRMKPGKPFVFGTRDHAGRRASVAGLPGNPVSALVTFHIFVRQILARLLSQNVEPWLTAQAAAPFPANTDREFFQPCTLQQTPSALRATPLSWRGSGDIFTLARAHALARRPCNAAEAPTGSPIEILPL